MIFQEAPFGIFSVQIIIWTSFAIDFMISNTYFKLEVIISHHYYLKLNSLKASKWLETNASSGFIFSLCVITCCRKNTPIQSQKGSSINGMWQTVIMNFYNCPNKWNGTEIECDNIFFKTDRQALSPNIMQIFFVHFVEHGMQWWKKAWWLRSYWLRAELLKRLADDIYFCFAYFFPRFCRINPIKFNRLIVFL